MMTNKVGINANNVLEINVASPEAEAPVYKALSNGFTNITESVNEVIKQFSCLGDGGWGRSEVTGGQITITLTGTRYYGDEAQDYIFGEEIKYNFGEKRKTSLKITRPNGKVIIWDVTLANIVDTGGDANAATDISVTFHGNGAPKYEEAKA